MCKNQQILSCKLRIAPDNLTLFNNGSNSKTKWNTQESGEVGVSKNLAKDFFIGPSKNKFLNYGLKGAENFASEFEKSEGKMNFGQALMAFGIGSLNAYLNDKVLGLGATKGFFGGVSAYAIPAATQMVFDYKTNVVNYYIKSLTDADPSKRGKIRFDLWGSWYKSFFKSDVIGSGAFLGNRFGYFNSLHNTWAR